MAKKEERIAIKTDATLSCLIKEMLIFSLVFTNGIIEEYCVLQNY